MTKPHDRTTETIQEVVSYIRRQYEPMAMIVYGSYADGTNNEHSDFDALVIARTHPYTHEVSHIAGVALDVFVYPKAHFDAAWDYDAFLPLSEGTILFDTDGVAQRVQNEVIRFLNAQPHQSAEEVRSEVAWCQKMLLRAERGDVEGAFRRHWVLTDSLEIFCDAVHHRYTGPKKTLRWMQQEYPQAFALYQCALQETGMLHLKRWITHLRSLTE